MSLLTDKDYAEWRESYSKYGMMNEAMARAAFKAAEATVIAKLATVSVGPDLIKTDEVDRYGDSIYIEAYSTEALAAARAQALEEAAKMPCPVCKELIDKE